MSLWAVDEFMSSCYCAVCLPLSVAFVPVAWATVTTAHSFVW